MQHRILSLKLPEEADTVLLGSEIAKILKGNLPKIASQGLNIRLEGDLGAGKTTFVRAVLRALGVAGAVRSPTYTLLETYKIGDVQFNHFDFYRFEDPEEFDDAGFRESFGAGMIAATEWTEKAEPNVPAADLMLELKRDGRGRAAKLTALSSLGDEILAEVRS